MVPPRTLREYLMPQPAPARPGPTIEAWKKSIPELQDARFPKSPIPTPEEIEGMALDMVTPLAGTIGKAGGMAGREMLKRSKLVAANLPESFSRAKESLRNLLRGRASEPLPEAMRDRPLIQLEHSTPYLFEEPKISREVAGKGAGDYWQGPGLYGTEVPEVARHYRSETAFIPQVFRLPSGIVIDRDALMRQGEKFDIDDPRNAALNNLLQISSEYYDNPEAVQKALARAQETVRFRMSKLAKEKNPERRAELREALRDAQESLGSMGQYLDVRGQPRLGERVPMETHQATYRLQFAASPDELFNLQRPITDQPSSERLLAALQTVSTARPGETALDRALQVERTGTRSGWRPSPYEANELLVGNKPGGSDVFADIDPFELMQAMNAKGIVGNQYLTRLAAESPNLPQTYNYVIQDPRRVRLTDVWAAAPLGLALQRAELERPAADSTTRTKR